MKLAKIIAREQIICIDSDFGLKAVNGYFESPYCEFKDDDSIEKIGDTLQNLFDKDIKKLINPTIEIVFDKNNLGK